MCDTCLNPAPADVIAATLAADDEVTDAIVARSEEIVRVLGPARYVVDAFATDSGAWLAGARVAANGGPIDLAVERVRGPRGGARQREHILTASTDADARDAQRILALFD